MQHDSIGYKAIASAGQLAIKGVESFLNFFIREKESTPDPESFTWTAELEKNAPLLIRELEHGLADYTAIPNFDDLSSEQKKIITGEKRWKSFMLYIYGAAVADNIRQCPDTDRLLQNIPGMTTAFFSILEPHTSITPHRGPYKGILRYHLGLMIPMGDLCGIRIGTETYHWQVGKSLIFDDTITHEAWNQSGEIRVVLFVDFKRSYPFPINRFNDLMIYMIRKSPFIADILDKIERGK